MPLAQPATLKTPEGRAALAAWAPDVLVVVAYGLILPPRGARAAAARLREHPWLAAAALARRRADPARDPRGRRRNRRDASCSSTQGSIPGRCCSSARRPIGSHDTAGDLHDALVRARRRRAARSASTASRPARSRRAPQPADGATYAPKIDKSEARSTGARAPSQLDRQVRAFNPWPMAETSFAGETLRVLRARVADAAGQRSCARHLVRHRATTACASRAARACSRCASCSAPASGRSRRAISRTPCASTA